MQNLKAVTTGVVASIEFCWSIMANPAISACGYLEVRRKINMKRKRTATMDPTR
jgi:hypothetical protein